MNWEEWNHIAEIVKDLQASIQVLEKELDWVKKTVETLDATLSNEVKED